MRTKKVNRYYCEYCKKSGCAAGHMLKHERACTMNPHRVCGVCKMMQRDQAQIGDLIKLVPEITDIPCEDGECEPAYYEEVKRRLNDSLEKIRMASGDCPACILATLRQSIVPVWAASDFSFKDEMKRVWEDFNESNSCY